MRYSKKLLDSWFKTINTELFNDLLIKPDIVLIKHKHRKILSRYYYNNDYEFYGLTLFDKSYSGIGIYLHQNKKEFIDTFVHELVHIWQTQNGLEMTHGCDFQYWMIKAKYIGLIK